MPRNLIKKDLQRTGEYHDSEEHNSIGRYFTIAVLSYIRGVYRLASPLLLLADILLDFNNNRACATPGLLGTVRRPLV